MKQILIAEDDPHISTFLVKKFQANGFSTEVAKDGYQVLKLIFNHQFDLLILDLGLPGKDGEKVLEELRGQGQQIPIIILSAKNQLEDKIAGLEGGANDYMTKPFSFKELLARVRIQLRPASLAEQERSLSLPTTSKTATVVKLGDITLDLRQRTAKRGDQIISLSNQEFILLDTFLEHPNQILSREDLLNYVWGYSYDPNSNIVDVYVSYLRKKLGNNVIETIRGAGYRLRRG